MHFSCYWIGCSKLHSAGPGRLVPAGRTWAVALLAEWLLAARGSGRGRHHEGRHAQHPGLFSCRVYVIVVCDAGWDGWEVALVLHVAVQMAGFTRKQPAVKIPPWLHRWLL
jgi:hypothetical protein